MKMSLVYFSGLFLILAEIFINPQISISTIIEIALLIVLGVILFFLPLYTAHNKLVQEKKHYLNSFRTKLSNASFGMKADNATFENLSQDRATELIAYDIIEKKISSISNWPIDPTMIRTLTALAISTATTLVGRLLLLALNF